MTTRSSILFVIPDQIVRSILIEWVILTDVVRLDSAFCWKEKRSLFLSLLFSFNATGHVCRYREGEDCLALRWSVNRGVQLDGFSVTAAFMADEELQDSFLNKSGPTTRWINIVKFGKGQRFVRIMKKIARLCPNTETLRVLSESQPSFSCDKIFLQLTSAFQCLNDLRLNCFQISAKGLKAILQHCSMLTSLELFYFAPTMPVMIALPRLTSLVVWDCGKVPEAVLLAVATNCPQLETLLMFQEMDENPTDAAVQLLLQGCPLLNMVDAEFATGLSHELRMDLARRSRYTQLELHSTSWTHADAELVMCLFRQSPNLKTLLAMHSAGLTDEALEVCAQHCKGLIGIN